MSANFRTRRILPFPDGREPAITKKVKLNGLEWALGEVGCYLECQLEKTGAVRLYVHFRSPNLTEAIIELDECIDERIVTEMVEAYDIPFSSALDEDELNKCLTRVAADYCGSMELGFSFGNSSIEEALAITLHMGMQAVDTDTPFEQVKPFLRRAEGVTK